MRANSRWSWATLIAGILATGGALAQAQVAPAEKRELIYCADRMTHEEREAYRAKMRAARTLEEKARIRADHQAEMQARVASQDAAGQCEAAGRNRQNERGGPGR